MIIHSQEIIKCKVLFSAKVWIAVMTLYGVVDGCPCFGDNSSLQYGAYTPGYIIS
jgi:hypothetical protein